MKAKKTAVLLVLLALLVIGGAVALWVRASPSMDPDAQPKNSPNMTAEEWNEYLQEQADASQLRFKVNTAMKVEPDGSTDLLLENAAENQSDIQAVLTLSDGTILYRSTILPPGGQELQVKLTQLPPQGSHTGTVTIQALDPATGMVIGRADVGVSLEVKEVGP